MDKARAGVVGDVIAGEHGDVVIPLLDLLPFHVFNARKGWAR